MFLVDAGIALAVAVGAGFLYSRYGKKVSVAVGSVEGKASAFARVAEQEGKLIALKAVTAAKKAEAVAVHATLTEIDKLLG